MDSAMAAESEEIDGVIRLERMRMAYLRACWWWWCEEVGVCESDR